MAAVRSVAGLIVGAVIFAGGMSLLYPALLVMALSGAPDAERASVVRTFSSFFDLAKARRVAVQRGPADLRLLRRICRQCSPGRSRLRPLRAGRIAEKGRSPVKPEPTPALGSTLTSLLVTNDFPPKVGGVSRACRSCGNDCPSGRRPVLTTPHLSAAEFDAALDFRVERVRSHVLLPTRGRAADRCACARDQRRRRLRRSDAPTQAHRTPTFAGVPYVVIRTGRDHAARTRCRYPRARATGAAQRPVSSRRGVPGGCVRPHGQPTRPAHGDPSRYRSAAFPPDRHARRAAVRKYRIDPERPLVLGLSRLVPARGFDVLIARSPNSTTRSARDCGQRSDERRLMDLSPSRTRFIPWCASSIACPAAEIRAAVRVPPMCSLDVVRDR